MQYHIIAFVAGFLTDGVFGDPHWLPHPIRLIGTLISRTENFLRKDKENVTPEQEIKQGRWMVWIVLGATIFCSALTLVLAYQWNKIVGCVVESIMTYQILAARSLKVESMKVYHELKKEDLPGARKAVSMIVGRDTACLDETGVAKAAIETVAENTADGVIAPMLYMAIGGPVLGFLYKAINTMDSMIGYKNEKYLHFGRTAAKLDDMVNFLPARISAWIMILAA